ncbi:aldo/keto reductase [Alteribacter natronophilus]|uniref:aldo/keto reductase n=1 Tax=Alteribacter natronophilus TaxID=2583810 RepID=UPI00110F1052|nr:aldo/keto reductase [Alteribacter natronophilus]TMW73689.1 aldo/keto reductase [Alteribacter natronophilus]
MNKRQIGNSDLFVSEIGFGCMSLTENDRENERIIHESIDRGINYFDTADLYSFGANEESVGKALKGKRDSVILASKGGNEWGEGIDGWRWNPSKNHMKDAVKKTLSRLGTDYLDLYQLHGGTIDDPIEETIEAFGEMKKEGLIRYYGISSIRPNVIKEYVKRSDIVSVMMQYSLLDRRPEEWFTFLGENGVSVLPRGPVAKGLLAEEWERKLKGEGYLQYSEEELKSTVKSLGDIAAREGITLQELALRYALTPPQVASAVAGASRVSQAADNAAAGAAGPLSEELVRELNDLTKAGRYDKHRD